MSFNNLGLIEPIKQALSATGYTTPTQIQEKSIPAILNRTDLLACAQTGTGKTAAFTLPILQLIHQGHRTGDEKRVITGLILAPTRELALQIGESIETYGRFLDIRHQVIFGGVPQFNQVKALKAGTDIVVATPGRLLDLIQQKHVSLRHVRFFVLDEADRMLDCGFINDIRKIIDYLPAQRQNLLFSATMPTPIRQLANMLLKNPVSIQVAPVSSTAELIEQSVYFVEKKNKPELLIELLKDEKIENVLVFTQMKYAADRLAKQLQRAGINSSAIHGNKSQIQRQQALKNFKNRTTRVLVATDIAARGIDIDELTHVINYELPNVPETYVHRIGRTGRAGAAGNAISLCDYSEKIFLKDIEKLTGKVIQKIAGHKFDIPDMHITSAPPVQSGYTARRQQNVFSGRKGRSFTQRA